jgi:protein translocase SecG subunit
MSLITISQLIVSVILIALILIQERSAGFSGLFGGGGEGGFYQTRRGLERFAYRATLVLTAIFVILSLISLTTQV